MESTTLKPTSPKSGPGQQLRQARQDLRLAPEDVAHILHLSPKLILALEKDDYDTLPGPTYVRGYLRGYAQLLGLSADKVVESYNRLAAATKPVDLGKLAPQPEIRSDNRLIQGASVLVAVIVLGLAVAWWRGQAEKLPPLARAPAASAPAGENEPSLADAANIPVPILDSPGLHPGPLDPASPAIAPTSAVTRETPVEAASKKPGRSELKPVAAAPATAAPVAAVRPPAAVPPDAPRSKLVLHTEQDSWADIRDVAQNKLLYETIPAGRTVVIEGVPPLSVFLGNVEGVRLEYDGQPYDALRHKRGPVARFTLGARAADR